MSQRTGWAERGAAAVEMALVLPLLALILGGIIDFGRAYFTNIMLANASREGARAAVVLNAGTPDASIEARALAAIPGNPIAATATVNRNCVGATSASAPASVTVQAPFDYFFVGLVPGVTDPPNLNSTAVMRCV